MKLMTDILSRYLVQSQGTVGIYLLLVQTIYDPV